MVTGMEPVLAFIIPEAVRVAMMIPGRTGFMNGSDAESLKGERATVNLSAACLKAE